MSLSIKALARALYCFDSESLAVSQVFIRSKSIPINKLLFIPFSINSLFSPMFSGEKNNKSKRSKRIRRRRGAKLLLSVLVDNLS